MEVTMLPSSLFSRAIRKYEYGVVRKQGGKVFFTSLEGKESLIEDMSKLEGQDGKKFDIGRVRGEKPVKVRRKDGGEYNYIAVRLDGLKDEKFLERQKAKGESLKITLDGKVLQDRNIVLMTNPPIVYDDLKTFLAECIQTELYDSSKKGQVLAQAKEERLVREGKNNQPVIKPKEEAMDWNEEARNKRLEEEKLTEGDFDVDAQIKQTINGESVRTGFIIIHKNDANRKEREITLAQAKQLCQAGKIRNMRLDESGKFVGVGMYITNLRIVKV